MQRSSRPELVVGKPPERLLGHLSRGRRIRHLRVLVRLDHALHLVHQGVVDGVAVDRVVRDSPPPAISLPFWKTA